VIFPDADLKVFLDADPGERARRRAAERGESQSEAVAAVARELAERDDRDRSRTVAPLAAAPDAVRVDSSAMSFEAVVARLVAEARARMAAK
jgi:cytidylate kinase